MQAAHTDCNVPSVPAGWACSSCLTQVSGSQQLERMVFPSSMDTRLGPADTTGKTGLDLAAGVSHSRGSVNGTQTRPACGDFVSRGSGTSRNSLEANRDC